VHIIVTLKLFIFSNAALTRFLISETKQTFLLAYTKMRRQPPCTHKMYFLVHSFLYREQVYLLQLLEPLTFFDIRFCKHFNR
jgi:hypothetical protein